MKNIIQIGKNSWYSYRILIIRGFGSGKTNALFNLASQQPDIDKMYPKDLYEAKYQLLINGLEGVGLKHYNDSKPFSEYSDDIGFTLGIKIIKVIKIEDGAFKT